MALNYITPISSIIPVEQIKTQNISEQSSKESINGVSFADMLKKAMEDVNQTNSDTDIDTLSLVTGMTGDNLHNIEIAAVKADLALRSMVSVRNKILDAYSEVMRITL